MCCTRHQWSEAGSRGCGQINLYWDWARQLLPAVTCINQNIYKITWNKNKLLKIVSGYFQFSFFFGLHNPSSSVGLSGGWNTLDTELGTNVLRARLWWRHSIKLQLFHNTAATLTLCSFYLWLRHWTVIFYSFWEYYQSMVRKDKLVSSDFMMSSKTNKMMGDGRIN